METHISVIFKIMDRFRKRPLLAPEISIAVNGIITRPLYKTGGYFIFTDLAPGETCFEFAAPVFQKETLTADIPAPGRGYILSHLLLNPSRAYPFGGSVTTVAGRIIRDKLPWSNRQFYLVPDNGMELMKVAEDNAGAGNDDLKLFVSGPQTKLSFPGEYLIKDKDEGKREVCLITRGDARDGTYALEKGINFSHSRGTPLVGVVACRTTADGSFFTALPDLAGEQVALDLLVEAKNGKGSKKTVQIAGNQYNILADLEI